MNEYKSKKICPHCHVAFDSDRKNCPECGAEVPDKTKREIQFDEFKEGDGRKYGAGGEACNFCPVCHGSRYWCPYID